MKLDPDATIEDRKLVRYLLAPRTRSDKSGFLALAGYTQARWQRLETDLREQILVLEAEFSRTSPYGDRYTIRGPLRGPNGRVLQILSVWIVEQATQRTRLITIYPDRRADL